MIGPERGRLPAPNTAHLFAILLVRAGAGRLLTHAPPHHTKLAKVAGSGGAVHERHPGMGRDLFYWHVPRPIGLDHQLGTLVEEPCACTSVSLRFPPRVSDIPLLCVAPAIARRIAHTFGAAVFAEARRFEMALQMSSALIPLAVHTVIMSSSSGVKRGAIARKGARA